MSLGFVSSALWPAACVVNTPADPNAPTMAQSAPGPGEEGAEHGGNGAPPGLRQHPPVQCLGNEEIYLEGVYIDAPDSGVEVVGNCEVRIVSSHIAAGTYGISITGNGNVQVQDSVVEGQAGSVHIVGNGDLQAAGSRFIGARSVTGNGEIIDGGGNLWE